jgi:hypothetical protein
VHHRTDLASAPINGADRILIELIQPPDSPAFVAVTWSLKASISTVEAFPALASKAATLLAQAATKLAQLRRDGLR